MTGVSCPPWGQPLVLTNAFPQLVEWMTPTEERFETSSLPSQESGLGNSLSGNVPCWGRFSLLLLGLCQAVLMGFRLVGIGHSASFFSHLASGEVVENRPIWSTALKVLSNHTHSIFSSDRGHLACFRFGESAVIVRPNLLSI